MQVGKVHLLLTHLALMVGPVHLEPHHDSLSLRDRHFIKKPRYVEGQEERFVYSHGIENFPGMIKAFLAWHAGWQFGWHYSGVLSGIGWVVSYLGYGP